MRILVQSFVGLLLSAAALSLWADQVVEKPVAADTPEKFVEVVDHIKKGNGSRRALRVHTPR